MKGDNPPEQDLKDLTKEVEKLKYQMNEIVKLRSEDIQRINKLEFYIKEKRSNPHRDYAALAQELCGLIAQRILKYRDYRRASLSYKEVLLYLKLNYPTEAYRVMMRAEKNYPEWMKYKKRGKKVMLSPTTSFAEHVRATEGLIWKRTSITPAV